MVVACLLTIQVTVSYHLKKKKKKSWDREARKVMVLWHIKAFSSRLMRREKWAEHNWLIVVNCHKKFCWDAFPGDLTIFNLILHGSELLKIQNLTWLSHSSWCVLPFGGKKLLCGFSSFSIWNSGLFDFFIHHHQSCLLCTHCCLFHSMPRLVISYLWNF